MLNAMRSKASRWFAAGILFLVLLAIVVTGFGTGGFGGLGNLGGAGRPAGDELATVEGNPISAAQVNDMVGRAYARAHDQQPNLDMAAFLAQGAFEQTVAQLITTTALQHYGNARGLTVSTRMVDREIVNIPAFHNFTGQFDQNTFRAMLAQQSVTEAQLRDDISRSLMQRQLLGPIALGARVPEAVAREYAALLLEKRRGTIGVVPAALMAPGINPTEAELAAFYQRNRAAFTVPEQRMFKYALISADQIPPASVTPTEAEIAAVYQHNAAFYGPHETRSLHAIVLPTQAAAQAFAARVRAGTPFLDAASQAGFAANDVSFADQRRDQFAATAGAQVADAAFAGAVGAVVGPLRSEFGFHVVRVESVNRTAARPLEAVRGDIAHALEQRKRTAALAALVGRIEDRISDGASFEEAAQGEHLVTLTTPALTRDGHTVGGPPWPVPADVQPLLRAGFDIDSESPEPAVETIRANERFALLGLGRVVPAAPPPLAQIHDQVRDAYVRRTALTRARAAAQAIADRINHGMPAAQAFAQSGLSLPALQHIDMRRIDMSRGQQVPPPLIALFSIPEHHARTLPAPNNAGFFVIAHEQRTPGDTATQPQLIATTRQQFNSSAAEELAQEFARGAELKSNVVRNQPAIQAERARLGGGAAAE